MADACTGPNGEDLCHLARGPPILDFSATALQRHRSSLEKARVKRAKRTAKAALAEQTSPAAVAPPSSPPRVKRAKRTAKAALAERTSPATVAPPSSPPPTSPRDEQVDPYRQVQPRLRANTATLSPVEIDKARMVRASRTFYKQGLRAAQVEIDASTLRGWRIDGALSTPEGLVLEKGGQVKIAYRGTDWSNVNDVVTNASTIGGAEEHVSQIRSSRVQFEQVQGKYGAVSELLGYSKGGAHAMALGDHFKVPSTTFNPLVGRKQLTTTSEVSHTIIRTLEDAPSSGLALAQNKRNYSVKAIDPIRGMGGLKSTHELHQFTSAGPRQPGGIEVLAAEGVRKGQMLAHLETLDAMASGVEARKTFTQALDDFNRSNGHVQRVDVLEDGSLGPRIHRHSGTVQYWRDAGGAFSIRCPRRTNHPSDNAQTCSWRTTSFL